jgi:HEAT repeat protein
MLRARTLLFGCVVALGVCGLAGAQALVVQPAPGVQIRGKIKIQVVGQPVAPKTEEKAPTKPLDPVAEDEKTLRDVGVGTDGPGALDYFRKRTLKEANPKQVEKLIRQLGDDEFTIREKAFTALGNLGAAATEGLKTAENSPDAEIKQRVLDLKQRIEAKAEPAIQAAAARAIARLKPAGAAEVVLAYLPFAVDQGVVDELCKGLAAVAVRDGKADPAIVRALADKAPIKRAAAGEALARSATGQPLADARALLHDPDPGVRLRVALALVPKKEKEVVPVLIDLLADLEPEQSWQAEEVLLRLAGDKAPQVATGSDPAARKVARDAWRDWYGKHKAEVNLAKLEEPDALLGYTLIVQQNFNRMAAIRRVAGEVLELKADKKTVNFRFEVPTYPVDAVVSGPNRVLVAEYQGGRVTERDFKGNVVWEVQTGGNPIGVQKLPNGNVFVVTQNRLAEYDRNKKEVFSHQRPQHDLVRGRKLRNGEVALLTNTGQFMRLDAKGRNVLKTFNVTPLHTPFGSMDVLPNGHVLIPDFQRHRVVEYDADGKETKAFNVQWPCSATRLPNGNTLVTSQNNRRIVEFNRNGQEEWSHTCDGNVFNARRR